MTSRANLFACRCPPHHAVHEMVAFIKTEAEAGLAALNKP
jgi:hypothetical protein